MCCRRSATESEGCLPVSLDHRRQASGGLRGRLCHLDYAFQEESQPPLPVAVGPYALELFVVDVTVALEVEAEIQQRLAQDFLGAEQESYEEAPDAPIARTNV